MIQIPVADERGAKPKQCSRVRRHFIKPKPEGCSDQTIQSFFLHRITFVSPAKTFGADLAQARCVTNGFVWCKPLLAGFPANHEVRSVDRMVLFHVTVFAWHPILLPTVSIRFSIAFDPALQPQLARAIDPDSKIVLSSQLVATRGYTLNDQYLARYYLVNLRKRVFDPIVSLKTSVAPVAKRIENLITEPFPIEIAANWLLAALAFHSERRREVEIVEVHNFYALPGRFQLGGQDVCESRFTRAALTVNRDERCRAIRLKR
jgi:hypothetical protein